MTVEEYDDMKDIVDEKLSDARSALGDILRILKALEPQDLTRFQSDYGRALDAYNRLC